MAINQNDAASSSTSLNISDNSTLPPWSNLYQDLLFKIMMELGPVDFYAFSGACKSWRSLALTHKNKFMGSRQPMSVSFSNNTKNECYLQDFEGRKFKTVVPHSTGRICVGLTCGYMIFFGSKTGDFWLVNPFTRHELHFPNLPFNEKASPSISKGILVFSPVVSRWVFVFSNKFSTRIFFSFSGDQGSWDYISSKFRILDLHSFNGKIYGISNGSRLFEVVLDPTPTLTLLGMKNSPKREFPSEFVNSGENLYLVDCIFPDMHKVYEIDFEKMEWVLIQKAKVEYAFFLGSLKSSAAINPDAWGDRRIHYERFGYRINTGKSKIKGRCLTAEMWYFPHDCA